jgi:hypothetical protein
MGLLIVGLMMGLVALTLVELGAASDNPRSQASLETMFYAGAAMCVAGAVIFLIRVMIARRRA